MRRWIYKWLPIVFGCHCMDERSFHFQGERFPICARCTGELFGMIIAMLTYIQISPGLGLSVLLMLPMVADGMIQMLTKYESTNLRRLMTGLLFGYGLVCVFFETTAIVFQYGAVLGEQWSVG